MATKSSTKTLSNLVINKVASPSVYQSMVSNNQINSDELYLVAGDSSPSPGSSSPAMDGTASAGSSDNYARADHVHPTDTSRAAASHTHAASDITSGLATVATSGSYADLSDKPSIPDATSDLTNDSGFITSSDIPVTSVNSKTGAVSLTYTDVGAAASSHGTHVTFDTTNNPAMDGTASKGTATTVARSDHVHPTDTSRAAAIHTHSASDITSGLATVATSGSYSDLSNKPSIPDSTSDLTNDSGFITGSDIPVTSVNSKTGAVSLTYTDVGAAAASHGTHVTFDTTNNPAMDGTAAKGSATTVARSDHVHPTDTSRAPTSHASSATTYGTGTSANYGHVKLSDSTSSTSSTNGGVAATPAAVKAVADSIPSVPSWALESTKPTYTASEVGAASSTHSHGDITSAGDITTTATIASGDRIIINDESASKVTNSSITFGTSTTQYLANNGTWQNIPSDSDTTYSLSMSGNRITLTPSSGTATYVDLPIYNGTVV